jgi:hypothetical protein
MLDRVDSTGRGMPVKRAMFGLLLALGAPAVAGPSQAPAAAAKAFLDSIYGPWMLKLKKPNGPVYKEPPHDRVYAPEITALLTKDEKNSARSGEVGVIDGVILCSCQDDGGMTAKVSVSVASATSATAKVALAFDGKYAKTLTIKLSKLPQGWRIADVSDPPDMPSLLGMLRKELGDKR